MRKPKHKQRGYNRQRAAVKRWRNSPIGRMCVTLLSRKVREAILKEGFSLSMMSCNMIVTQREGEAW